jgi:hypothetical protein
MLRVQSKSSGKPTLQMRSSCRCLHHTHLSVGRPGAAEVRVPKAGLNRGILASAWGVLVKRLEDKAPGRVEKVPPA